MTITYLKFMQKYIATYKGKAIGIGNTIVEAITHALQVITTK